MAVDLETVKPSFAKATTTTISATTSRSTALPSPPPRAPKNPVQMQSVSNMLPPMLSQAVHIPPMPRIPTSNNNKENKDASIPPSPKASNASSSKTKSPPSGWIQATRPPPALPAKVMQAPFTKKLSSGKPGSSGSKGQTSLNGFVVKADLSTASDAESSFASTSSSSSGIGKKRSAERAEPWGEEAMKPQKAAKTEKGKGKGPGIGSLNVKQQIVLSAEQQKVLKMVVDEKKNVFFTGSAGETISVLSLPGLPDVLCIARYRKVDSSTRNHRFSSTKVCSQGRRPSLYYRIYRYGSCQHRWYNDPFLCGYRSRPRHRRTTRRFRSQEPKSFR